MMRKPNLSPSLSMSILAACLGVVFGAGCSSSDDDVPTVVTLEPWGRTVGGSGTSVQITSVTAGASGNIALAGNFTGTIDLGAGPLKSTATPNLFLGKLDQDGQHIWSGRTGGGDDTVSGIALDRGGSVIAAGGFNGFVDFGSGGELDGVGDVFLARFGAEGDPLWARQFGGDSSADNVNDIKVDSSGGVYLLGTALGDIDFGLGQVLPGQYANLYIAKMNSASGAVYSVGFTTADYCTPRRIAVDTEGNAVIVGDFYGALDFGGGPIASNDSYGMFVLKLDANGHHKWSKAFTASSGGIDVGGNVGSGDVAFDPSGDILMTGTFGGSADFGGGAITTGDNYNALYLVKLGADGSHKFSKAFVSDNNGYGQVVGVGVDVNGDIRVAGTFSSSLDLGDKTLTSAGQDIFLAKFDGSGKLLDSKQFGNGSYPSLSAFAITTGGNPILAGSFSGTLDFGSPKITAPENSSQAFVVVLAP